MAGPRGLQKIAGRMGFLFLLAAVLAVPACVYFNTYYNAQKFFRQAEDLRQKQEREAATSDREGGRGGRSGASSASELYDKAARRAAKVLEQHQESDLVDDAAFLMGRALYWQGDYLNALRAFRDLQSNYPTSEFFDQARYWEARCYEAQNLTAEARTAYRTLVEAGRGEVAYQSGYRLGEMAFGRGEYLQAIQEYRATLEAFPRAANRAELWLRLGEAVMALEDEGRYPEALTAFTQVLREHPPDEMEYRARLNRGRLLYAQGDVEGALADYRRLLEESRFRRFEGQTRLLIGQYYQDRRLPEQALGEYEQVRDDFPQTEASAMALYHTGLLYLQGYGDLEQAREYFQEAPKEKPGSKGAELGQEKLKELEQLDHLMASIRRADSLAVGARADSAAPDSASSGEVPAAGKGANITGLDSAKTQQLQADLFAVAELYRDELVQPDSAAHYYQEIAARFPDSDQIPRTLYSLVWVYREMKKEPEAAQPYVERLIATYPKSEQTNAARRLLGQEVQVTDEERAAAEFVQVESLWVQNRQDLAAYVPRLDSLAVRYPGTRSAAQAAYLAAWTYENVQGDSLEAGRRFDRLLVEYPGSPYAELVQKRRQAREEGLAEKLSQELQAVGRIEQGGKRLEVIAVEPDSADSSALARKYLGFALRAQKRGDLPVARRLYESSLEQQERSAEALYRLGQIMWQEGYFQDAKDYYLRSLRCDPGLLRAHYGLVAAYTTAGAVDSANYYLREVVKRDRRNPQVEQLLEQYPALDQPGTAGKGTGTASGPQLDRSELEGLELKPPEEEEVPPQKRLGLREAPLLRAEAKPEYPPGAGGDSAEVIVDVLVDKEGKPDSIQVFRGEEPFRQAAEEAARKYRFFPAVGRGGDKARVWVELAMVLAPPENAPPAGGALPPVPGNAPPDQVEGRQESDAGRKDAPVLQPGSSPGVLPEPAGSPPDSL